MGRIWTDELEALWTGSRDENVIALRSRMRRWAERVAQDNRRHDSARARCAATGCQDCESERGLCRNYCDAAEELRRGAR